MSLKIFERDATILHTPYCDFIVVDSEGSRISFDILDTPAKEVEVYLNNDGNQAAPAQYGMGRTIRIHTDNLEVGKDYYIRTSEKLQNRDSDERLFTFGLTGKDFTFAVSFPDPNDLIKADLGYEPERFQYYNIEYNGMDFVLHLIDRKEKYIDIFTYWIWNIKNHMEDYEDACDVATWWCP